MKANVEIYELKILKGPDRLMRINIIIKQTYNLETSIELLAEIIASIVYRHHKLEIEFPAAELLASIPEEKSCFGARPGEIFNGMIGMEILINKRTESIFKIRLYPEELEFERNVSSADHYLLMNKLNLDDYEFKYSTNELRRGFEKPDLSHKITFPISENIQ